MVAYILRSQKTGRYYTGVTEDLAARLQQHNAGRTSSTRHGVPWEVVYSRSCENRSLAVQLEREIKSRGAKRFLESQEYFKILRGVAQPG
ncbi:MAG: GIY-YIG nuclease family protein [Bacteroidetes bacterium]|nr:GIY-YIG nuclease family protein [Bacteroidota bacterium]MCW5895649.1 GIY-YIG nuclease family protein [Bacteroidota bacterium]